MFITKEMLEARRKELIAQFEKLSADRNATLGALQDCEYWLAQYGKPEPTEETP